MIWYALLIARNLFCDIMASCGLLLQFAASLSAGEFRQPDFCSSSIFLFQAIRTHGSCGGFNCRVPAACIFLHADR